MNRELLEDIVRLLESSQNAQTNFVIEKDELEALAALLKCARLGIFLANTPIIGKSLDIIKELAGIKYGTNEPTQDQIDIIWSDFVDIVS